MRVLPSLLCLALVFSVAPQGVAAADDVSALGLLQPVDLLVASTNSNLPSGVAAAYVAAPTIVDDFAPFRWSGEGAPLRWLRDYRAGTRSEGMTRLNLVRHAPSYLRVSGSRAWAVVPMEVSFYMKAKRRSEEGSWTFVLVWNGKEWRIESSAWAQTSDMVVVE